MVLISLLLWYCYNKPVLSNKVPLAVLAIFFLRVKLQVAKAAQSVILVFLVCM